MKDVMLNVNASLSVALYGIAGIGKSSCAMKMATDYLKAGKDVVWINADMHEDNLLELIKDTQFDVNYTLPGKLHIYTVDYAGVTIDVVKGILEKIKDYVSKTGSSIGLIVIDNVGRNNTDVMEMLRARFQGSGTSLLFTKRYVTGVDSSKTSRIVDYVYTINNDGSGYIKYGKYAMSILKNRSTTGLGIFTQVGPEKLEVKTSDGGSINVLLYPKEE